MQGPGRQGRRAKQSTPAAAQDLARRISAPHADLGRGAALPLSMISRPAPLLVKEAAQLADELAAQLADELAAQLVDELAAQRLLLPMNTRSSCQ